MPEVHASLSGTISSRLRDKARGALLGLAAGDSLGWPQEIPRKTVRRPEPAAPSCEFQEWVRHTGGRFYAHTETVRKGEYSDDTQLALAVARSRAFAGDAWQTALTRTELPLWSLYERGGGGATKRAAASWARATAPWLQDQASTGQYFAAGGNGVAMRVLPHAIHHACAGKPNALIRQVVEDGIATHGHPRALIGAAALAYAAWWLLRLDRTMEYGELVQVMQDSVDTWGDFVATGGCPANWLESAGRTRPENYATHWRRVANEMLELFATAERGIAQAAVADDDAVLRELGCFGREKGSGTVSAAAAIYLSARHAPQPPRGVLVAAFANGADTDTLAAMTGGLLGSLVGADQLPAAWRSIQDFEYLVATADSLAPIPETSKAGLSARAPRALGKRELNTLRTALASESTSPIDFDGVRHVTIVESTDQDTFSKTASVRTWKLASDDGQTFYVKKFERIRHRIRQPTADRHWMHPPGVSENTAAILLLTTPLAEKDPGRLALLAPSEYRGFAALLRRLHHRPSDLLQANADSLLKHCETVIERSRLDRLLSRRALLEEACRSWSEKGIWVISRADPPYPKRLKSRRREDSPVLLYGYGDQGLLQGGGLAVFGLDSEDSDLIGYSEKAGRLTAEAGWVLLSPGFTRLDQAAIRGARDSGGRVLALCRQVPVSSKIAHATPETAVAENSAVVSMHDPVGPSTPGSAETDSQLVLDLADAALVIDAHPRQGYPWGSVARLLRQEPSIPIFVRTDGNASDGLEELRKLGARAWSETEPGTDVTRFLSRMEAAELGQAPLPFAASTREADSGRPIEPEPRPGSQAARKPSQPDDPVQPPAGGPLDSIEAFLASLAQQPRNATEIADTLGISKGAAEQWLGSLVQRGLLDRDTGAGRYSLHRLGSAQSNEADPDTDPARKD